ncbi:HLH-domain-containing protein [Myriangium duriaei CBS 260.36]|uniref:HLH-domain-containing protein n=1 Tax=Myriangium duriaei CBS 260.36 TaxID=1168546 RepID=A0A9P4J4J9_9PEZI|nr:HLH-domain-containing protein [Myriangium duriaei CBS 260.36]
MPAPKLPPTPGASLDLTGKVTASHAPSLSLGPAARDGGSDRSLSATPSANGSESSYHPVSPVPPSIAKRKQPNSSKPASKSGDDFALPPPPSRSRKIIQMKPRPDDQQIDVSGTADASAATAKGGRKRGANAGTTAAGRKIARKTAHSLIERRRRSKMNEEFDTLKNMIPACRGQEMHKLAILQASIEYLRYLESCITDLKAAGRSHPSIPQPIDVDTTMDQDDPDEPMSDPEAEKCGPSSTFMAQTAPHSYTQTTSQAPQPTYSPQSLPPLSTVTTVSNPQSSTSPTFPPLDSSRPRQFSLSSSLAASPYILPSSSNTSPVFTAQHKSSLANVAGEAMQRFSLTSPALEPQDKHHRRERSDREAMAALLMLNSDRRRDTWGSGTGDAEVGRERPTRVSERGSRSGGAMSVRDLLSP